MLSNYVPDVPAYFTQRLTEGYTRRFGSKFNFSAELYEDLVRDAPKMGAEASFDKWWANEIGSTLDLAPMLRDNTEEDMREIMGAASEGRILPRSVPFPLGLCQHFKGGLYRILFYGTDATGEKPVTIYMSMKDGRIWTRPTAEFYDLARWPGGVLGMRFVPKVGKP